MNPRTLLCILLAAGPGMAVAAQEEPAAVAGEELASAVEAEVDPLTLLSEPGEHHEHLDRLAGDWDLTLRVWSSPDGEPTEAVGTAEARWILGGRFLWTIYRAELFGRPFEAWSIEGYDNQANQYVGTWRDTQGTYTLVYRGRCSSKAPTEDTDQDTDKGDAAEDEEEVEGSYRRMSSQLTDPASGETLSIRTELRILDEGSFIQESFIVLSPEESLKNLEIVGRQRSAE